MKKWTVIMLLVAVVLFGSVIGFNMFKQQKIAEFMASMPEPEFPITVVETKAQEWSPTISAIGFIEPNQGVTIANEISGKVSHISFESGDMVKAGQLLVELNSDVEIANLKSAKAKLKAAKSKYQRYESLYKKKAVSKEAFDESEATYLSLLADIESQKAAIDRRQIKAPFDGEVGLRNVYLGQYLSTGTEIVRLEDTSVLRLRFTIPQTDISRVNVGQTVKIQVDSYPNKAFSGHITAIEPAVHYQSGLIQVQANIPNSDSLLRSGMFARAEILLDTMKDQYTLPQVAITYTLYGDNVYIAAKDDEGVLRVKQTVINVGERLADSAHILSGIKTGDMVVTSGQVRLSNNAKVRVVESTALDTPAETPML